MLYLPQYPSGHFYLSSPWHMCPSTCFSRTNCSLSRYNAKDKLDCFNCKTGIFSQIINFIVYKRKQLQSTFLEKIQLRYGEDLTIIKKWSIPRVQLLHCVLSSSTMYQFS